ncbi:MFS general substrate transporter [Meredithblackwellia eburnea MCA 4105]
MSNTPPILEPPKAHIPLSSFPAASPLHVQGISRPPSPSSTPQTPVPSRPPSPSRPELHETYSIDDISYPPTSNSSFVRPSNSRSVSRSKDPFFKRVHAVGRGGKLSFLPWLRRTHETPHRGRTGFLEGESSNALVVSPSKSMRWPLSRERAQMIVAFCMIGLVGMNDSATGANLPAMQSYYNVSYDKISTVFLANVAGYFLSSVSSAALSHHLGLQKGLLVAALFMGGGCIMLSFGPPFAVFILAIAALGFGGGLYDAMLTTVISHSEDGVLMSLMYACFGVGAMFSPLIIGSFIDHGFSWTAYYFMPLGLTVTLAMIAFPVFSTYEAPPDETHVQQGPDLERTPSVGEVVGGRAVASVGTRMKRALGIKSVWVGFLLMLLAFGTGDTLSAWMVSFMIEKRQAREADSRYQLSGLWGGIALGRIALAYLGRKMGEKTFSILMLFAASACLSIVWAVRNVPVDALALVGAGFFLGPVTPKVLSMVSARIPPSLKSSVMSLTLGVGLVGSSAGPLLFGIVAGRGGLGSLPACLLITSCIGAISWTLVPKNTRRED